MKKYASLLLAALCGQSVCADTVSAEQAAAIASRFATSSRTMRVAPATARVSLLTETDGCYLFNRGTNGGYIIVAKDDAVDNTVLGFADEGHLNTESLPAPLKAWLCEMDRQVTYAAAHPVAQAERAPRLHSNIDPLCTCSWDQDYPYNILVPLSNGSRSHTGCVATAMTQVMYRHKWPEHGTGSVSSGGETIDLSQQTYQWNIMTDVVNSSSSNETINAVATLMRDAGYAIHTDYHSTSASLSYESEAANALIKNFFYSESICTISRSNFTKSGWDEVCYNELANGRPMMIAGYNSEGGHCFVCDGYRDGYYHINWGWGGLSNAFLRMDTMIPATQGAGGTSGGYEGSMEAVIGIQPATDEATYLELVYNKADFKAISTTAQRSGNATFSGSFSHGTRATSYTCTLGIEVIDAEGNSTFLPATESTSLTGSSVGGWGGQPGGGGWGGNSNNTSTYDVKLTDFPQADGTYTVRCAYQGASGTWHSMNHAFKLQSELTAVVKGDEITFSTPFALAYEMTPLHMRISNATPTAKQAITAAFTISGVRGNYYGDIHLAFYQNGQKKSEGSTTIVSIEEGEQLNFSLKGNVPSTDGLTEVYVVDSEGNKWGSPAYLVVGGSNNDCTIELTKTIEMPATENVNKYDIVLYAQLTCKKGDYVGKVQANVCGGKRYNTVMGVLTSDTYVIPEGQTIDVVVSGSIESLDDLTKYKVYLVDNNGAYFEGMSAYDNIYFTTGANMQPPTDETAVHVVTADNEKEEPVYTLDGRRVSRPERRGIYIKNGKKVLR